MLYQKRHIKGGKEPLMEKKNVNRNPTYLVLLDFNDFSLQNPNNDVLGKKKNENVGELKP